MVEAASLLHRGSHMRLAYARPQAQQLCCQLGSCPHSSTAIASCGACSCASRGAPNSAPLHTHPKLYTKRTGKTWSSAWGLGAQRTRGPSAGNLRRTTRGRQCVSFSSIQWPARGRRTGAAAGEDRLYNLVVAMAGAVCCKPL